MAAKSKKKKKSPVKERIFQERLLPQKIGIPACKHFGGYKPCFPNTQCYKKCVDFDPIGKRILVINLDAMGNILVTTSILPSLKRKYPESHISWITLRVSAPLLANNLYLDRVYAWEPESWLVLQHMKFDVVLNVDKSERSCAFMNSLRSSAKLGFGLNPRGQIVPLNKKAKENYILGLDDHLKFRVNTKSVPQLLCEEFGLEYSRDDYILAFTKEEEAFKRGFRSQHGLENRSLIVGFNTGCSELYPNKKMTIDQHVALIERLAETPRIQLLLLGGPEDTQRNAEIARRVGDKALSTPTRDGLRKGLVYIDLCDVVISGDSFGMHAAIGLRKHVIVWFGVSCSSEIDLFDRGIKLIPHDLSCSPCWKRSCPYGLECIQMIDLDAIVSEVLRVRDGGEGGGLPHGSLIETGPKSF